MSSMSRTNSNPLMGFSVHQPAVGAALQFFPAMGSSQLDEMIDAYIPGGASILDKRAAVSMEFFQHTIATGESFKFFMVYPTLGSAGASPTTSSSYHSSLAASPTTPESQWSSSSSRVASRSPKKATAASDLSNLPGMKIMTKDGRDVTNSASRGCKTKEQRDHAHLMRIIKACDSCRRKKTKCDPSHKRPAAVMSSGKVVKRTSKSTRPVAVPPLVSAPPPEVISELDQILNGSPSSLDSLLTESLNASADGFSMDWDQFIQYDEEPADMIPYDQGFFFDPADYFSPATAASFTSSSASPSSRQPITPIDPDVSILDHTNEGHNHMPILPYLNPRGLEAGSNYVDFTLFSPQSSFLDEELDSAKEISASPVQSQLGYGHHSRESRQEAVTDVTGTEPSLSAAVNEVADSCPYDVFSNTVTNGSFWRASDDVYQLPGRVTGAEAATGGAALNAGSTRSTHAATNRRVSCDKHGSSHNRDTISILSQPQVATNVAGGVTARHRKRPAVPEISEIFNSGIDAASIRAPSDPPAPTAVNNRLQGNACNDTRTIHSTVMPMIGMCRAPSWAIRAPRDLPAPNSPTVRMGLLGDTCDNTRNIHSSAATTTGMIGMPPAPSHVLLPSSLSLVVSSPSNTATPSAKSKSRAIVNAQGQTEVPVSVTPGTSLGKHGLGLVVRFNEESMRGKLATVKQNVSIKRDQLVPSAILPTLRAIAGVAALAVVASLTSIRAIMASQGLASGAKLILSGESAVSGITALLILSFTIFAPARLMSLMRNALSAIAGCILQQRDFVNMQTHSVSRKLCVARKFLSTCQAASASRAHSHSATGSRRSPGSTPYIPVMESYCEM